MATTAFYFDESCFWHFGGNYASVVKVGGLVQPLAGGGLPENPETKRRLKNLIDITGLAAELDCRSAPAATRADLLRVHPESYIDEFKRLSDAEGGEVGLRTPFGPGGFEIASLSAGLAIGAVASVLSGEHRNAYALSRPPGHHCLPDFPMGFCLMANIPIALAAARAARPDLRVAVIDWDVHHGNGTEAIFYDDPATLTISIHQEGNFPTDKGEAGDAGAGAGTGFNVNIPIAPGAGHDAFLYAYDRIVAPKVEAFAPDLIVVACGYDASGVDPLSRTVAGSNTFAVLTERALAQAEALCGGKIVFVHEGGYSEVHVPFCGHAVLQRMAGSAIEAEDPLGARVAAHQPRAKATAFHRGWIDDLAAGHGL
ncbi:MAG: class II histone deacetylase [Pseudomonadota bacterium]